MMMGDQRVIIVDVMLDIDDSWVLAEPGKAVKLSDKDIGVTYDGKVNVIPRTMLTAVKKEVKEEVKAPGLPPSLRPPVSGQVTHYNPQSK